jgi:tetratricopeptide (TPR) repeat protein
MSRNPVSAGGRADTAEVKHELLGRLGLGADASDQEVEAARNGLVDFLELAPREVKAWAAAQTADVDEAFALLSGPEQDLVSAAPVAAIAVGELDETPPPPPPATPAANFTPAAPAAPKPRRNLIIGAVAAVAAVGIIFAVAQMGKTPVPGIDGKPTNAATTASSSPSAVPVDPAKVAALMTKVAANPKDIVSFQSLGDLYFAATDYKNASLWMRKILAVAPTNEKALLSLGAAQFNVGNSAEAKKQWLVAAKLYPKSQEVHYDLGFLYMSQTPPDSVNMKAEWKKVVDIDPNSELAKTVATHIKAPTATPSAK